MACSELNCTFAPIPSFVVRGVVGFGSTQVRFGFGLGSVWLFGLGLG